MMRSKVEKIIIVYLIIITKNNFIKCLPVEFGLETQEHSKVTETTETTIEADSPEPISPTWNNKAVFSVDANEGTLDVSTKLATTERQTLFFDEQPRINETTSENVEPAASAEHATPASSPSMSTAVNNENWNGVEDEAYAYLAKFGYLQEEKQSNDISSNYIDLDAALMKFQKFTGINVTGKLDDSTIAWMHKPRCQLPDTIAPNRFKRFAAKTKWKKNKLSYYIHNHPSNTHDMKDPRLVNGAIDTAFQDWSSVANINIGRTINGKKADIQVNFEKFNHSDGYPFDGKGVILAHGFYPQDGRLHLDDDEKWSTNGLGGPNLRQVASHEIGHVLGLGHSNVRSAIMFPYYKYVENFKLDADDIEGAVYLYGPKEQSINGSTLRRPSWLNWWV